MPNIVSVERFVYVTFALEGFHAWKDAPDSVAFLRDRHRHMFHFKATVSVKHDYREIEFILLKQELMGVMKNSTNNMSCEQLAGALVSYIGTHYPGRYIEVEVSEDGENGAIVSYTPTNQPGKTEA